MRQADYTLQLSCSQISDPEENVFCYTVDNCGIGGMPLADYENPSSLGKAR
jgi:hypothetical protein